MAVIREKDIRYSDMSLADPVGRLFHWKGGIYRGIYPASAALVRDLFASGCLEALMARGLFPRSRITDHVLDGFSFVVEHEKIDCVCYPHEWSFDMLREAGQAVLEVVKISGRFGWDLKDGHPYNVVFANSRPIYVDLGSFEKKTKDAGFKNGLDFVRLYWRPLYLWSLGDAFMARRLISSANADQPDFSWWLYRHPTLGRLGSPWNQWLAKKTTRWLRRAARYLGHGRAVSWLSPRLASWLPAEIVARNPDLLRRKLAALKLPPPDPWDDYHLDYVEKGEFVSTPRFDRIIEIIRSLGCESVVELAGNQGLFTLLLSRKTSITRMVCTDYSSSAINRFHHYCQAQSHSLSGQSLQAAVLNFMLPEWSARETRPSERFKSDAVVALAVTHHLVLTQNFSLQEVLRTMAAYTRDVALVEFMPKGLWTGKNAPPVPEWYTEEWFQKSFSEFFDVLTVERLEENRILFVGRLKSAVAENLAEDVFEFFEAHQVAA